MKFRTMGTFQKPNMMTDIAMTYEENDVNLNTHTSAGIHIQRIARPPAQQYGTSTEVMLRCQCTHLVTGRSDCACARRRGWNLGAQWGCYRGPRSHRVVRMGRRGCKTSLQREMRSGGEISSSYILNSVWAVMYVEDQPECTGRYA